MISTRVACAVALIAAAGLAGCNSTSQALGLSKVTPDEFRIVTKAPLVVPPDYALRPPSPSEARCRRTGRPEPSVRFMMRQEVAPGAILV